MVKKIDVITRVLPLVSQTAILLIIGAVVSANHAGLFTAATAMVIPVVMLHNLSGYGLGFLFSKLIRLKDPQRKAITFEVGMQDSSLGATLAMKYFSPAAAIPSTIFSIWHNISGQSCHHIGVEKPQRLLIKRLLINQQNQLQQQKSNSIFS